MDDFNEEITKKEKYSIRLDVYFDEPISKEEADIKIYSALKSVGVTGYKGMVN
jgi:hypothetical protein